MDNAMDRLQAVFRDVFDDEDLVINRSTSASDVESWDSLSHVTLITKVEREYGIRFSSSEVARLQDAGELADLIEKKLQK